MDKSGRPSTTDRLRTQIEAGEYEHITASLERLEGAEGRAKQEALRQLRAVGNEKLRAISEHSPALTPFLVDDERPVRLATAKLFVALAEVRAERLDAVVPALADRLADEEEFYYVRARSAEALGYIARAHPEMVASPETLADLRVGLSFDEPEVKEKLAKALEYVAGGDPRRLRHHVPTLGDHLSDENELVRYHLATALVIVGCEYPERLAAVTDALGARLVDENAFIRGRAAEALGVFARRACEACDERALPTATLGEMATDDEEESFAANRARFAREAVDATGKPASSDEIGSVSGVRATTSEAVDEITAPETDGECPLCGFELPRDGPKMCPQCGAPY
ncbi:hypothetical protein C440_06047 [Haloferax mucosum ATCC BAA-1512]|uniref:Uncharacterized protein n=1 Tax=Haloferax mucosum ATCC BAA-1512 TaxID=662479 RepID=M0IIY5_9EURY|nr:HEAT repeat domain-containing protein [Haloferax mucosum]ELZ95828.1 hypothetical protein C440_06047 [Haloferax mucosum ATCC BAA-1512]